MALFDPAQAPARLPSADVIPPEVNDPQTLEQLLQPKPEPLPQPAPMKTMLAANGEVPLPERGGVQNSDSQAVPPMPERGPSQAQLRSLTDPEDSRYKDPKNLLMGDVITGGSLPWIQAAADVAAGRVPAEKFDEVRQEHARRLQELRDEHPEFVEAAHKAMPFLEGLGMSVMKPAASVAGTIARGAGVAAPQGAVRGYTSGPIEEPSISGERAVRGVTGAATDAAIGAAGASVPSLVKGAGDLIGKAATSMAARKAVRETEAAAARSAAEAKAKAAATADKRRASTEKGKATKLAKAQKIEMDKKFAAENDELLGSYQKMRAQPSKTSQFADDNRKIFLQDPTHAFNQAAEGKMSLEMMSAALGLSQRQIVNRLSRADFPLDTPEKKQLFQQMMNVDSVWNKVKTRGLVDKVTGEPPAPPKPPSSPPPPPASSETPMSDKLRDFMNRPKSPETPSQPPPEGKVVPFTGTTRVRTPEPETPPPEPPPTKPTKARKPAAKKPAAPKKPRKPKEPK